MKRPSIKSPCVADRYADKTCERIAEFSAPNGKGGLIAVRQHPDGAVTVAVYRLDPGVTVTVDPDAITGQPLAALRAPVNLNEMRALPLHADLSEVSAKALLGALWLRIWPEART